MPHRSNPELKVSRGTDGIAKNILQESKEPFIKISVRVIRSVSVQYLQPPREVLVQTTLFCITEAFGNRSAEDIASNGINKPTELPWPTTERNTKTAEYTTHTDVRQGLNKHQYLGRPSCILPEHHTQR